MSEEREKRLVGGFAFASIEEAGQAQKEEEGVRFIREKLDMNNPKKVLEIYNKLVRERLFETALGVSYLKELQEYLCMSPAIAKEDILPIQVRHSALEKQMRKRLEASGKKQRVRERYVNVDYKNRYRITVGIAFALFFCVAAMFAISATAGHPTILNYEEKLLNRYAGWDEELQERENAIREKEAQLGIQAE